MAVLSQYSSGMATNVSRPPGDKNGYNLPPSSTLSGPF
jgi:hypothetical protein